MALILSFAEQIESYIPLPPFKKELLLQRSNNSFFTPVPDETIEELSLSVRRSLNIGNGPIDNITRLCEKLGIIVVFLDLSKSTIDGCSTMYKGRPYIVLNKHAFSSVRMRFTLAHELGHILLHSTLPRKHTNNSTNHKQIEKEANLFASFLLMPEESFVQDVNGLGLDYLLMLKKHWKVSMQAMIYRAEYLEIFTEDYALYLRQQVSRKGWRKFEPFDEEIDFEHSVLLKQALMFLDTNKNVNINEIVFKTGISENEIAETVGLYPQNNEKSNARVNQSVQLKRIK